MSLGSWQAADETMGGERDPKLTSKESKILLAMLHFVTFYSENGGGTGSTPKAEAPSSAQSLCNHTYAFKPWGALHSCWLESRMQHPWRQWTNLPASLLRTKPAW